MMFITQKRIQFIVFLLVYVIVMQVLLNFEEFNT